MQEARYESLAEFASRFDAEPDQAPPWMFAPAASPLRLDTPSLRFRLEDVLDTMVAIQRAEWLADGVFVSPNTLPHVYRDVLEGARRLGTAVPPTVVSGEALRTQGPLGTDTRAYLRLSAYFLESAGPSERRFVIGRSLGLIAARLVTPHTLYVVLVDQQEIRALARKSLGPVLEIALAPVSLGARLALARWHRAAELAADRAGLLHCRDVQAAGRALLRIALGVKPAVDPEAWLADLQRAPSASGPSTWAEAFSGHPWIHKRLQALADFSNSQLYHRLIDAPAPSAAIDDQELDRRTRQRLQVTP